MEENDKVQIGKSATPETKAWRAFMLEQEQKTPERLEDVAKALSGMVSITLAIFLTIGRQEFENSPDVTIAIALIIWLVSLILSFLVVFPFPYSYSKQSAKTFINTHKRTKRRTYIEIFGIEV
jgi:hypothetical protein